MNIHCEMCGYEQNPENGECSRCLAGPPNTYGRSLWGKVCVCLWLLFNGLMIVWKVQNPRLSPEELRSAGDPVAGFAGAFDAMAHDAMLLFWAFGNMVLLLLVALTAPEQ